jgi:3-hydroxyacyl-[acyl-carrier-protein] dehydratase
MTDQMLVNLEKASFNEITAEACPEPDSLWFSGHFPDEPILPGIAQLAMVSEAIGRLHENLKIKCVRRVKFRQIIKPNDRLKLNVKQAADHPERFDFRIMREGEVACSGIMETVNKSGKERTRV